MPARHGRGGRLDSSATTRSAPEAGRAALPDPAATAGEERAKGGDGRGGTPARALPPATAGPWPAAAAASVTLGRAGGGKGQRVGKEY